jgi:hypothetical protein
MSNGGRRWALGLDPLNRVLPLTFTFHQQFSVREIALSFITYQTVSFTYEVADAAKTG